MSLATRKFEIGLIYQHPDKNQLFLSVSATTLISMHKGNVIKKTPRLVRYELKRGIEVDALCAAWNISSESLDKLSSQFLAPVQLETTKKRRGPKLSLEQQAALARNRLTARIGA